MQADPPHRLPNGPVRRLPVVAAPSDTDPWRTPPLSARISLTDRCDLACVYCRPSRTDGYLERRLDEEAYKAMMRALVQSGVRRFRITGGEPLLHPNVVERVAFLASLGVEDLALTTNATRLAKLARPLRAAGLQRLTVSLDSLVAARFWRITRGGRLSAVLSGIDAALEAGYPELKLNTVVLRGDNDDELADITSFAWARGIVPRFIEVMRVGEGARLAQEKLVGAAEMRKRLEHLLVAEPGEADPNRGPARYVRSRANPDQRVGFITGTTDTYCASCDRLRVASDGTLRPCLATNDGVAAMPLAQQGDVESIVDAVQEAWSLKPDGRTWKGCTEPTAAGVSMRAIGG
jgi:cyclic pyranopterin phosphate synthase